MIEDLSYNCHFSVKKCDIITIIVEGIFQLNRFPGIKAKGDELFKEAMKMIYEGILTSEGKESFRSRWK